MAYSYIELVTLDILEVQGHRVLSRLGLVHIADAMRSQVDLAILLVGQLVLSKGGRCVSDSVSLIRAPGA